MRCAVLIVFAIMFLYSCEHYYDISKSIDPEFNAGDVFFYESNLTAAIDTMYVMKKKYEVEDSDKTYHYESLSCVIINMNKNIKYEIQYSGNDFSLYVIEGENVFMYDEYDSCLDLTLNGAKYKNVFLLTNADNIINVPDTLFFSPKKGILKYSVDNEKYNLIKE